MRCMERFARSYKVALLVEGVDRNPFLLVRVALMDWSPSSWRAWIEIPADH